MEQNNIKDFNEKDWLKHFDQLGIQFIDSAGNILERIKDIVNNTPNDQELGELIRKLINGNKI